MSEYNPDKTVQDNYTGKMKEPSEDRSIIQPDGSRACYNWECKGNGFNHLQNPEKLTLDHKTKQKLTELGIPAYATSIDDLLETDVWHKLSPEQQTQAYFLLEEAAETSDNDAINLKEYLPRTDEIQLTHLRQIISTTVIDPNADFSTLPQNTYCKVAKDQDEIVGFIIYEDEQGVRQLRECVVAEDYRRQGVMSRLIGSVEDPQYKLAALVRKDRKEALEAFIKMGFELEDTSPSGYYVITKNSYF
ncbi:GNAT family N-acetyltransferase [Candidatus Woesearchaeota archaeon]|nr:GNAT family N-acetyltransferase [Candidatus Woesearchaeota archaeon]